LKYRFLLGTGHIPLRIPLAGGTTHVRGLFGEGLGVAGHGLPLPLVDVGQNALLVHGGQLVLLGVAFFLECLNRSLKLHSHIKTYCTPREKDYQHGEFSSIDNNMQLSIGLSVF